MGAAATAATAQTYLDKAKRSKSAAQVKATTFMEKAVRGVFQQYAADRMAIALHFTDLDSDCIRAAESCLKACEKSMKARVPLCGGIKFQQLLFAEFEEWVKRINKGHGELLGSATQVHNMLCRPDFSSTVLLHALGRAMNPQRTQDHPSDLEHFVRIFAIFHEPSTDIWKVAKVVVLVVWRTVGWILTAIGYLLMMLLSAADDAGQSATPSIRPSSYQGQSAAWYSSASADTIPSPSYSSSSSFHVAPSSSYSSSSSSSSGTIFSTGQRGGLKYITRTGSERHVSINRPARANRLRAEVARG